MAEALNANHRCRSPWGSRRTALLSDARKKVQCFDKLSTNGERDLSANPLLNHDLPGHPEGRMHEMRAMRLIGPGRRRRQAHIH